jgi:simple sugar transport system permease protein
MNTSAPVAIVAAMLVAAVAGGLMATIHAFVTVTLRANQTVSGLALTIFGTGLSSYIGQLGNLGGQACHHVFGSLDIFGLKNLPLLGPVVFGENAAVYASWVLAIAVWYYVYRTRSGMHLRAVGDEPRAADAMGVNVTAYRYGHTIAGGAFAGIAGSLFTLAISPSWTAGMTEGAGWIAVALVIFAFWNPGLVVVGAYLFGIVLSLGLNLQARGVQLPTELFSSLPYLMTIVVLVLVSTAFAKRRIGAPRALGLPYSREEG